LALATALIAVSAGGAGNCDTRGKSHADTVPAEAETAATVHEPTEEMGLLTSDVSVNMPCDTEWKRAYYTAWHTRANDAIESADNALYTEFGINLYVAASPSCWDSDDSETDICKLLDDAVAACGKGGYDMMIAFTGQVSDCGCAYMNDDYCIVTKSPGPSPRSASMRYPTATAPATAPVTVASASSPTAWPTSASGATPVIRIPGTTATASDHSAAGFGRTGHVIGQESWRGPGATRKTNARRTTPF